MQSCRLTRVTGFRDARRHFLDHVTPEQLSAIGAAFETLRAVQVADHGAVAVASAPPAPEVVVEAPIV
ncbi:MAG: hypothetical protein NVS4B2_28400 [Chloroflexota bacterium]